MNDIYGYIDCGNSNIYGFYSNGGLTDRINYLLDKVDEINSRELLNKYEQTQIENENELNNAVNSKYSYYKMQEPRKINGSGLKMKKQFRFNRK